jgi:hypothetical protein
MTLIVESGEGIPGANTYIDADYVDGYLTGDTLALWEGLDDSAKTAAIINASRYIDVTFNWKGKRKSLAQGLNFPRVGVTLDDFPVEGVPDPVKRAVAEAAALLIQGEELFQSGDERAVTSERVDVIQVTYRDRALDPASPARFDALNLIVRGLYKTAPVSGAGGVGNAKVARV